MKVINIAQGSPEWHAHRAKFFNASDAPAMMGVSPYKTRNELLHERATGMAKEVNAVTQKRFDEGHRFEALARAIAESVIGEELYPVTGCNDRYSASYDGMSFGETKGFEHKSLNDELRAIFADIQTMNPEHHEGSAGKLLPLYHRVQMEQQYMVNELLEQILFMASKWDESGKLLEEHHCWYQPDLELRQQIIDGWAQFEKDLAVYMHEVIPEKLKAAEVEAFPVPSIQVRGELVACNLAEITPLFDKFLGETKTNLTTDQDFADGEANSKTSREAAKNLRLTAKAVVDQIAPVSEAVRTLELYASKFDALGLTLEKAVKEQKDAIKTTAILKAKNTWSEHIAALEAEISPIRLSLIQPDFAASVKGIKTIKSLHSNIADAIANAKIEVDAIAKDIRSKLAWCKENAGGHSALFPDLQQIIYKPIDDFQMVISMRIRRHQEEQEAKIKEEAERLAKIEVERLEKEREAKAKAEAEEKELVETPEPAMTFKEVTQSVLPSDLSKTFIGMDIGNSEMAVVHSTTNNTTTLYFTGPTPSAEEIVQAVALAFKANTETSLNWLLKSDFTKVDLLKLKAA